MTNEELFADLKQFITGTVSQEMANVATKDDIKEINGRIDTLDARISTVDEKIDLIHDAIAESVTNTDKLVQDHEQRISTLERRAA